MRTLSRIARFLKTALVILAAVLVPRISTGDAGRENSSVETRDTPTASSISRKLDLLERLTNTPTTLRRIENSSNSDAEAYLASARKALREASSAFESGSLEQAALAIQNGYGQMTLALRNAKDPAREAGNELARYEKLSRSVYSFTEAFQRIAREKNNPAIYALLDQDHISGLLIEAEVFAAKGNHGAANGRMSEASAMVERALSKARNEETLLHELKFETPEQEYDYELQRNESYALLVTLFDRQGVSKPAALDALRVAVHRNETVRREARASFAEGHVREAIDKLEKSSDAIARLLQVSGLAF